jgi:hypothetical protein
MKERLMKADGLEETVRRQELVIEKLEAMINNYMKEKRLRGLVIFLETEAWRRELIKKTDFC